MNIKVILVLSSILVAAFGGIHSADPLINILCLDNHNFIQYP